MLDMYIYFYQNHCFKGHVIHVCVEKCRHYTRSNLQLLYILHSFFQSQFSVPMSTATEGDVHITIDRKNGWRR